MLTIRDFVNDRSSYIVEVMISHTSDDPRHTRGQFDQLECVLSTIALELQKIERIFNTSNRSKIEDYYYDDKDAKEFGFSFDADCYHTNDFAYSLVVFNMRSDEDFEKVAEVFDRFDKERLQKLKPI